MNSNTLLALLPYLKYLPLIINVVSAMTDLVESNADEGANSAEKQAAARDAIKDVLTH